MTLEAKVAELIGAGFSGIWIRTSEPDEAAREIQALGIANKWTVATWDIDRGVRYPDGKGSPDTQDPIAAVKHLRNLCKPEQTAVMLFTNMHRFLNNVQLMQATAHQIAAGKIERGFVVVLSPVIQIPVELEKLFVVVEHDLPDRAQLEAIAREVATEAGDLPADMAPVLDAASGLTRYEAEGAFALSLVRHHKVNTETLWELKSGMLKKTGLLSLHRGGERFADLGGLDNLKRFCSKALAHGDRPADAKPRGVLLLGVSGSGKSAFCKSLGNEVGRPTVILDVGALMGSLVGATEENTRKALAAVDAMGSCVLFVDEIEKSLSGGSDGGNDSGVGRRLFGTLLTWLNDHTSDVFFVGSANDISALPPEFTRAERFDGVFFLDLPGREEKDAIWRMYVDRYFKDGKRGYRPMGATPDDTNWTGAEIKSCCRLAAMLGVTLEEAAQNVVPVAVTSADKVQGLREWASGRCLSAGRPGVYRKDAGEQVEKPTRKLVRAKVGA